MGYIIWTAAICAIVGLILNDIVFARKAKKMIERKRNEALENTLVELGLGQRSTD